MFDNLSYYLPAFGVIALLFVFYKLAVLPERKIDSQQQKFLRQLKTFYLLIQYLTS